jgi:beta-glucanase (GH16 family)
VSRRLIGSIAAAAAIVSTAALGLSGAPATMASTRPAARHGMHLVFSATFTGRKLNPKVWDTCYAWMSDPGKGCTNFSNTEYEWYLPSQVQVSGGALHLVAKAVRTVGLSKTGKSKVYACRSGMVSSYPDFNFKYGKITVVARTPAGNGLWSALWLAASNRKWPPEADLLEFWGKPKDLTGVFFHGVGLSTKEHPKTANLTKGWHTYTLDWTSSRMTWYIDGHEVMTVTRHVPHQDMYFLANVAEYMPVTAHSGRCNGTMLIRSVQAWQS